MLNNFLTQLRENPRLRWGVVLIIGTCWLYGILLLRDAVQEEARIHRTASLALARLQTQATQTEWLARVTPAKALAVQLESKLWRAATPGLAQAAFQDALNAITLKAAATRPQVNVVVIDNAPPDPANPQPETSSLVPTDLWKVKANMSFDFAAPSLLELLRQIESHDRQFVIGKLSLSRAPPNRVDMELYGYFQKPADVATNPAVPAKSI